MSNGRSGDERTREARVDAAWRSASAEEPTPEADAAILAAAREEVRRPAPSPPAARRPPQWRTRWQPLAAAAGVATLALFLVQRLPTEPGSDERSPAAVPAAPAASAEGEMSAPSAAPITPRPQERAGSADALPTQSQSASPEMNAIATAKSAVAAPDPDTWIRRIVALHEAGDLPAAAAELRAFRSRYPDADALLPAEVAVWAATVDPDLER